MDSSYPNPLNSSSFGVSTVLPMEGDSGASFIPFKAAESDWSSNKFVAAVPGELCCMLTVVDVNHWSNYDLRGL